MASEFPKTLYRYDETGERIGKTFAAPEQVETGWISIDDLGPPPPKAATAPVVSSKEAGEAAKRLVAAEGEVSRLRDTVKLYESETQHKDATLAAYKGLLSTIRDDENCPEALRAAIGDVLAPNEAGQPALTKPKRGKA